MQHSGSLRELPSIISFLEKLVQEQYSTNDHINAVKFEEIGKHKGFMSKIYKVSLGYEKQSHNLPAAVIVKLPTDANVKDFLEKMPDFSEFWNADMVRRLHSREILLYEFFEKQKTLPLPIPRIFHMERPGADHIGMIIMEFVTGNSMGFNKDYSWEQIASLVRHIASLHAFSVKVGLPEGIGPLDNAFVGPSAKMLRSSLKKVRHLFPTIFTLSDSDIDKAVNLVGVARSKICNPDQLSYSPVLTLGDSQPNNILFCPDSMDRVASFLDFQFACPGSCVYDLCSIVFFGIEAKEPFLGSLDKILNMYFKAFEEGFPDRTPVLSVSAMRDELVCIYPAFVSFMAAYFTSKESLREVSGIKEDRMDEYARRLKFAFLDCVKLSKY